MDDMQAAEILKVLAAGIGPAAGQSPAEPAHLQSAEVLRALFLGRRCAPDPRQGRTPAVGVTAQRRQALDA